MDGEWSSDVVQKGPQTRNGQAEAGLDGAERNTEGALDLGMRAVVEEGEAYHLRLLGRQAGECGAHALGVLDRLDHRIARGWRQRFLGHQIKPRGEAIAPHVSMGFDNMWVLLNDVLPRAIQKHGGFSADALAKAARETDIPEGGTMQGYGVKFNPPGHPMAGQNARAIAAVFQIQDGRFKHVYPPVVASGQPILPLPASSPFAAR